MTTFAISMPTWERPVPYRAETLKKLVGSGVFAHPGFRGIHITHKRGAATNAAMCLFQAAVSRPDWVFHLEDDAEVLKKHFAESVLAWLADHAVPSVHMYPLGCHHAKKFKKHATAWDYPLEVYYGAVGVALRGPFARLFAASLLDADPEGFNENIFDVHLKDYHFQEEPTVSHVLTPVPCFVDHRGAVSSLPTASDPKHYVGGYPGFQSDYVYKGKTR